jgi:hypothetical protein
MKPTPAATQSSVSDRWEYFTYVMIALLLLGGFISILIPPASAVPTTGAATLVGSNNATLSATGGGTTGWFTYGTNPGNEYWTTPNITIPAGGAFTYRIAHSPLTGNTLWYFTACDETGCGSENSFITTAVTPIPRTNLGGFYRNITESGFDIPNMATNLIAPFRWNPNIPLTIIFMLLFSPIFIGIWLRSRTVLIAMITGFITGSFILYANTGLQLGMPPEIIVVSQAICYIAFAGIVLYILHR